MTDNQTADAESIDSVPRCQSCGSLRVVKDAWACFNPETGLWELENVFDHEFCHSCEEETKCEWVPADALQNMRVRDLNDLFRAKGQGNGSVVITNGIDAEGKDFVLAALQAVRRFDDFSKENDPWGEHDFGAVEIDGQKLFFKLDYYDPSCRQGSENPANEGLTHRVLTIMLASEY